MAQQTTSDYHVFDVTTRVWLLKGAKVISWIVYAFVLVALVLLIIAFFLRLFGANPDAGFTEWIYRSVEEIMEPFRGIFPAENLSANSVLDFSLLFAIIIYSLFALLVGALVHWLTVRLHRATVAATAQQSRAATAAPPAAVYPPSVPPGVPPGVPPVPPPHPGTTPPPAP